MPWIGAAWRITLLRVAVIALPTGLAAFGSFRVRLTKALAQGPALWIAAVIFWCLLETLHPPYILFNDPAVLRPFASAEFMRILLGGSVFISAAFFLRDHELVPLVGGVSIMALLAALYGLGRVGTDEHFHDITAMFGNHEQAGSFLMMFIPVAAAFAITAGIPAGLTLSAQAATVILTASVLFTRTRSAWIGEMVGLCTLCVISLRFGSGIRWTEAKHRWIGPALLLIVGLIVIVLSSSDSPMLGKRLQTFQNISDDGPFTDRVHRWEGACRMAFERPVTGWGLGSFPVLLTRWTGSGDPPAWVILHGTGHQNLAHNYWVQWAADTGGVGLFLFVGAIASFLLTGVSAFRRMKPGVQRTLLIGCIAAVAGCCADMMGAPSYGYPGVSTLFFLILGIGVAACRPERLRSDIVEVSSSQRPWIPAISCAVGLAAIGWVMLVGSIQHPPASMADLLSHRALAARGSGTLEEH
jgi:O-antigen ligase